MKVTLFLMAVFIALAACDDSPSEAVEPQTNIQRISGTILFEERIGLTPESRLEVKLVDVSLADVPATVIAAVNTDNPGQAPLSFSIEYDADLIDDRHTYSIQVRIFDRDHLIMVSDTINRVLTPGAPSDLRIQVRRVARNPG